MDNSRLARPFLIIPGIFMVAALGIPLAYMMFLSFQTTWGVTAVSYTHLDVYKRQSLSHTCPVN